jgi:hypothetical protein
MFNWSAPEKLDPAPYINAPNKPPPSGFGETTGKLEAFSQHLQRERMATMARNNATSNSCTTNAYDKKDRWVRSTLQSPLLIALLGGIVIMILLAAIRPPFVRKRSDNPIHRPSADPSKIVLIGLISAGFILIIPMIQTKMKIGCTKPDKV